MSFSISATGKAVPGRLVSDYSEVQGSRLNIPLPLPSVLKNSFELVDGPPSSAVGNLEEIAEFFPKLFGQPSVTLKAVGASGEAAEERSLNIGVVLSGGQAAGGHNVISGLFDYLQARTRGSRLYGFRGGPAGILKCNYVGGFDMIRSGRDKIETPEQLKQAEETVTKLDLDGLVIIGGDDSNTNACLLAENFRAKNMKTKVIGCPKTIDGDLKCKEVPTTFGFDTACKIYSELIGNVMTDCRSTGKYYHFIRLMGRAASHITMECALQTHPNLAIIGEEAQQLIAELNEILLHEVIDASGVWKKKLQSHSREVFDLLPYAIRKQLLLERDPHGNVQLAKIETEKMLIEMVGTELEKRKQEGLFNGQFTGQSHFFGYEGRCGLPTIFDANYCYALGHAAGVLLHYGKTGLISSVGNLGAPAEEWTVGGTPLTSLMVVERRHGKFKPVIKKAMVELDGALFNKFVSLRDDWVLSNRYVNPGPIQFSGPTAEALTHTLQMELGIDA
ncbi:Pyrophosphate--fructose 6-phosphate 1-phosphotransferase subunit beta 1 [Morella rubra]|uniref:Pyrophosphate--fructose 6-phosphate 1-phosphotransferase subunit beta n=1 Tax=Morella rubra TaxID=262757 RepID=A0A6A1VFQ6_9ROSI|nr:Pyrophosphate--fructose 6-phosphate 1-phosphotransferase subunit beta 1 [Morella rubra]